MTDTSNFGGMDVSTLDQTLAEYSDAAALCPPGRNRRLRSLIGVRHAAVAALRGADYDSVDSPVPILRLVDGAFVGIRGRTGEEPVPRSATVMRCTNCNDPSGWTTPFWINCGTVVVQVDLCNPCTKYAMDDLAAEPQIGSLGQAS